MIDRRLLIALGAVAALALLFVAVRPDGDDDGAETRAAATAQPRAEPAPADDEPPAPSMPAADIRLRGGRPLGGIVRIEAKQGEPVTIVVRSDDRRAQVHVHGYDLLREAAPGRPARFVFRARLTGRFEVELEDEHRQIAQLTVRP